MTTTTANQNVNINQITPTQQIQQNNQSLAQLQLQQQMEHFPDILQHLPSDQCKMMFEMIAETNNMAIVNKPGPLGGYTALHWMCIKNEVDLIEFLINKCKADVNCKANLGEPPLFICIKNCNFYSIELLIEHGADLKARDVYNRSIIHWMAYTGKVVLFYYFEKYHSITDLNDIDQFQQNPMHIACASGFADLIKYLIDRGNIDLHAQDFNGNTCLHMAAKCGLPRTCWLITKQNNGQCAKLIGMINKQNQRPYDIIRNERAPHYKKIRDWLRLEAKTNEYLLSSNLIDAAEKKSDDFFLKNDSSSSLLKITRGTRFFKWNSDIKMKVEWLLRMLAFFIVLTIPQLINRFLFSEDDLTLWRGVVGYSTFIAIILVVTRQKHRISHISGLQNPYFMGFFLSLFAHNYTVFFYNIFGPFNILSLHDLYVVAITIWHFYSLYRILSANPGFSRESIKKPDGTPYDLKDLMKLNAKANARSTKDSINWLTEPTSNNNRPNQHLQAYFCDSCLIIQSVPAKHCKLCEGCCQKFDHHCLFILKCVGLKNHRHFINFLISTILCTTTFLFSIYFFIVEFNSNLAHSNEGKNPEDQITLFYLFFSSSLHVWLAVLVCVNGFASLMVLFLLIYQLRFITLGYTAQFPPPNFFIKTHKKMATLKDAILHRIDNLNTFFFKSFDCNEELYFKQQKDYFQNLPNNKSIMLGYYPRNNHDNHDHVNSMKVPSPNSYVNLNQGVSISMPMNTNTNTAVNSSNNNENKQQFEIDLD